MLPSVFCSSYFLPLQLFLQSKFKLFASEMENRTSLQEWEPLNSPGEILTVGQISSNTKENRMILNIILEYK